MIPLAAKWYQSAVTRIGFLEFLWIECTYILTHNPGYPVPLVRLRPAARAPDQIDERESESRVYKGEEFDRGYERGVRLLTYKVHRCTIVSSHTFKEFRLWNARSG